MIQCRDGLGELVELKAPAQQIISLVPSQTEWLAYLGLDAQVHSITKFCVHPFNWRNRKSIVGGTKNVHIERVEIAHPDLIIANKEENEKDSIRAIKEKYPIYVSDVKNVEDAFKMMRDTGKLTGKLDLAEDFIGQMKYKLSQIHKVPNGVKPRVLYVIWDNPIMAVGSDTYIDAIISLGQMRNAAASFSRYPIMDEKALQQVQPIDMVLLSSEPFPFAEKHIRKYESIFPDSEIRLVDGELFSWYGWRLTKTLDYLVDLDKKASDNSHNKLHLTS